MRRGVVLARALPLDVDLLELAVGLSTWPIWLCGLTSQASRPTATLFFRACKVVLAGIVSPIVAVCSRTRSRFAYTGARTVTDCPKLDVVERVDPVQRARARVDRDGGRNHDRDDRRRRPRDGRSVGPGRVRNRADRGDPPLVFPGRCGRRRLEHARTRSRSRWGTASCAKAAGSGCRVDDDAGVVLRENGQGVVDAGLCERCRLLAGVDAMRVARAGGGERDYRRERNRQDKHRDDREDEGDALLFAMKAAPRRDDAATVLSS